MAQNIGPLQGAYFSAVPAVDLPKQGGGTATFTDVTDTTATAADVAAGKYFYTAAGVLTEGTSTGGGGGFVDVVETLPNGGQHHKISGVDLSNDTVTAAHLESGYTAHDAEGNAITGTLVPGGGGGATLITKSITANGTYDAEDDNADGYSSVTVNVSGGGGGGTSEPRKDVNFFDYDGTIVASYTAQEALALNSLPSNPSRSGLTAQGWNYTLAQMKAEVTAQGRCDIGQMYVPTSGKTEIDVEFVDPIRLSPYLRFAVNGTVTVDWGDGTSTSTVTGSSTSTQQNVQHTYATIGKYTISLELTSGTAYAMYGSAVWTLLHNNQSTSGGGRVYSELVTAVRIGEDCMISSDAFAGCGSMEYCTLPSTLADVYVNFGNYAFSGCRSLKHVTVPSGITAISTYCFSACNNMKSVSLPSSVAAVGTYSFNNNYALIGVVVPSGVPEIYTYCFSNAYSLRYLAIPSSVTSIGTYAFQNTYTLQSLTIPNNVSTISGNCFNGMSGAKEVHIKPTTPPYLSSTNAFNYISSDCVFYVPSASLSDYKTASNWSSFQSRMQGE